jgi:NADH:ubiquinone oxidoreductase subunit 6 (subunit J)
MQEYFILFFLIILQCCSFFLFNQTQPITAIVALACSFLAGALIILFMGFEYISWIIIIVYIGAIIILFLFSVMLLHIKEDNRLFDTENNTNTKISALLYIYIIIFTLFVLYGDFNYIESQMIVSFENKYEQIPLVYKHTLSNSFYNTNLELDSELHALGLVLYTFGFPYLISVATILLVSLLGSVAIISSDTKQPAEIQNTINQVSKKTKY